MSSPTIELTAPADVYQARRAKLAAGLTRPLLILAGSPACRTYEGNTYPYRANSTYLYFGGPPLPEAALLIEPGSDGTAGVTLFRTPEGPDDAVWEGPRPTDDTIAQAAGLPISRLADRNAIGQRLNGKDAGFLAPPRLQTIESIAELSITPANDDERKRIVDMRLVKDATEIAAMRRAARVAVDAHKAAMAATKPGATEADVAAAFYAVIIANQCAPSFTPIITVRGETLHLEGHPNTLEAGGLLLVDGGAEEPGGYASDITRTFPVTGTWTDMQRKLYDTVLKAMNDAIAACTPGTRYREVHDLAARVVCEGLVAADLLRGDPEELAERYAHTLFFPHGVGHLLGLDVHDMEDYGDLAGYAAGRSRRTEFGNKFLRLDRDLKPGMVVTIEPGIYLVPAIWQREDLVGPFADVVNRPAVDELLAGNFGGIRIEEDVLVCDGAPEILTKDLPSDADAVSALVGVA